MTSNLERQRALLQGVADFQADQVAKAAVLDDYTTLARDVCGLAVEPHLPGVPYFDFDHEDSPYLTMAEFLDEDNGKNKAVFGVRGIGKSVLALMLQLKRILKDHNHTLRIGSEAKTEVLKRSLWIRGQLTRLEENYGPFRGADTWEKDRFTVIRPGGGVLDETVTLTSPDSPGTGAHPRGFLIDDGVGDIAEKSQAKMTAGVDWFKALGCQELAGTATWIIGTFRLGWNIYRYMIEVLEGGLRLRPHKKGLLHEGREFDILVFRDYQEDGSPTFPCQNATFLESRLKRVGKAVYKSQFQLLLPGEEDTTFSVRSFQWGEPPENVPLRTVILTDTATSTSRVRHTSMSCIAAVSKTPDDHAYVREMQLGKIDPRRVPEIMLRMWKEWQADKIVYEDAGRAYMSAVRALAQAQGIDAGVMRRMFHEISRGADKSYRIQMLAPHAEQGKLHISQKIGKGILRVEEDGRLGGVLGQEANSFYYGADGSFDGFDTLADIWGEDGKGQTIFLPPGKKDKEKLPADWYEYAAQIERERMGARGVF